jgi:hypothetical protein
MGEGLFSNQISESLSLITTSAADIGYQVNFADVVLAHLGNAFNKDEED